MNKRKLSAILLALPVMVLVAGLTGWWWLMHTGLGAQWLLDKAADTVAGDMSLTLVSGDLSSGLLLNDIVLDNQAVRVQVGSVEVAVRLNLLPIGLDFKRVHADDVEVRIKPDGTNQPDSENSPGDFTVPIRVVFGDIRISGLRFFSSPEAGAVVIPNIRAGAALSSSLVLDHLSLFLPEDQLNISGKIDLSYPYTMAITAESRGRLTIDGDLEGNVESAELVVDSANPAAHIEGTVTQLQRNPGWDLHIDAPSVLLPFKDIDTAVKLTTLEARTTGAWPQFDLDLNAILEAGWIEPARMTLSGNGTDRQFTVQSLTLDGPELSVEATGGVAWIETIQLQLATNIIRLHPGKWIPEWPEKHPVNGEVEVKWGGESLAIENFTFAVTNTGLVASGSGVFDPQKETVDLSLSWQDFSWPLGSEAMLVSSKSGSLQVGGNLDDWELEGNLDLRSGELPRGKLVLAGAGNKEALNIDLKDGKALGGTISGTLFWQWTGTQPFSAELSARQVEITPLLPDFPGVLNTRISVSGEIDPLRLSGNIHNLDGTILDLPVTGRGGFHIEKSRVFADELFLGSGTSSLILDGSLYEPGGISFSAEIDSLARFADNLSGSVAVDGNISMASASPRISVSLSGDDLDLGAIRIQHVETNNFREAEAENVTELALSGLQIRQRPVESMSIQFDGDKPLQWTRISAQTEDTRIQLELRGAVNDWNDPLASGWGGELTQFALDHQGRFNLDLDKQAALNWSQSGFMLEPACLSGTRGASLCVSSDWFGGDLNLSADLTAIPVALIDLAVNTDLIFTQIISGTFSWSKKTATSQNALAEFRVTPGSIRAEGGDEVLLETGEGLFGFELAGGKLQEGNLALAIQETGDINISFTVPDLSRGPDSPVEGNVKVEFYDMSALDRIQPLLDTINGRAKIDLALTGSVRDPAFNGTVSVHDGQFSNLASGFSFSDVNISGEIRDTDRAELAGTFRAGEGTGDIKTRVFFENAFAPVIELSLRGKSLTLIDVPDLKVIADPDIELGWRNQTLDINGRVFIPRARLSPSYLPQASERQSDDVVIVAGEMPAPEQDFLRDNPIKIRGNLEVELGKNAEIDLEFARVNVYGSTRFTWRDEILPVANGNFDLRGDIQAYGQMLKVTQGRIGFPDIPADNPHLNIRAERQIYGNTQIQKAGLLVAGTVKRPVIEAYTVPMTNKDRARTLLVTGSDFNYEQGVGAVAVGTYVLPKLYVSYGIGVFEEGNVISARYDLGKRFGVKVTSGQKDTGVDLNYTLER